ncbi:protein distal antenna-related-like [Teleopsis dalmanni]|uniref:protein distal antenna-related-like n=1 Tax=Teleopsis dalmanni TaxID=139649 RepID=UPI0018CCDC68|nr:protein distal antenna-related-like [Teleopsis dalmanni]
MDISAYQHMNIRMSTRGKRPLRNLTPSDKVRAIQRIHNGETKASVSRDIGVPESTLRGWCKNEQKLRFMCRQMSVDQMSLPGLENPPEKRTKLENHHASAKFQSISSFDDFAYNRLPLSGMDFAVNAINNNNQNSNGSNISSCNAFLEKIALNDFIKKTTSQAESNKQFGISSHLQNIGSLPISGDFSQLAMVQNINLMSLLNPNLVNVPSAGSSMESTKVKIPLRSSNSTEDTRESTKSTPTTPLSVKNWAKDPSENLSPIKNSTSSINSSNNKRINVNNNNNNNDTNNNDVKPKSLQSQLQLAEIGTFPFLQTGMPSILNPNADPDSANSALLEWCKVFNASLNFLALTAAAAALQSPTVNLSNTNDENESNTIQARPTENILYSQLTKMPHSFHMNSNSLMHSDMSNDSYYDSEPEDLSFRSNTSKISSPAHSRSQSPAKSISSAVQSDSEP